MRNYKITLACRNYDGTNAIVRGVIKPAGIDIRVLEMDNTEKMFRAMFRGEFDVSEMSLAELVYYHSRDACDFIGIPVFPSRLFRHGFILCNTSSQIFDPGSLNGKKIGFLRWVQTAHVWIRGMLIEEYGISPEETSWYVSAMHHWEDGDSTGDITPRDGSVINRLHWHGKDGYERTCLALREGGLDALAITENQKYMNYLASDGNIKRLFENYREAEASYFRKNKVIPIMHVMVARKSVVEQHPELPVKLFELFSESKKIGKAWLRTIPSLGLAWKNHYLEEEQAILGDDPWAYGLKKNAPALTKFLSYCYAQGISARKLNPRDLFVPSTWHLKE